MSRSLVFLRAAVLDDAPLLADLWVDGLRRADHDERVADVEHVVLAAAESPEQRIVVAEYDGRLAGAVLLRIATVSPINLEQTLQAVSPHVFPEFRRRGIGRALMESAVSFADERGIGHVATAAASGSRDANRFMARLSLGPHATLRIAPVAAVRARLHAQRPDLSPAGHGRQRTRVLAARRSMRRAQPPEPTVS